MSNEMYGTGRNEQYGSDNGLPIGAIIMWSGTIADIPAGFALCNGSNGTPDLRNRFVVCANADSGGAAKTTILGGALSSGGSTSHTHLFTADGHDHSIEYESVDVDNNGSYEIDVLDNYDTRHSDADGTTDPTVTVPPFFALAFIMKL